VRRPQQIERESREQAGEESMAAPMRRLYARCGDQPGADQRFFEGRFFDCVWTSMLAIALPRAPVS